VPPATTGSDGFRPDIEGLRGIAVALVVLFHSGIVEVPGGFVGVDVFFVISGFLITGLLIREKERTGRIRLPAFYARRVRRLLPAGMVALAATLVASFVILSPLDLPQAAGDGAAAALSVGNIRYALEAGDYFASVGSPSPFLHFWSLGVEEQFYLVWPALILLAAAHSRPRLGAGIALVAVVVTSFLANLILADVAVNWDFYSLPTRAWQLGLGGLIALGADSIERIPGRVRTVVGWAGLVAILASSLLLDGSLAYPGLYALGPTLGAAALILSGLTPGGPGGLLSVPPIRFLGRISYSLYLWHWPILVLPTESDWILPAGAPIALVGLAIVVAWASWRFIEEPFRVRFPSLSRRPVRTIVAGVTAIVVVVSMAGGLAAAAGLSNPDTPPTVAETVDPDEPPLDLGASPQALPTPTMRVVLLGSSAPPSPRPSATAIPTSTPLPSPVIRLPSDVRPALANARSDEERLRGDGCLGFERATRPPDCRYGDPDGTVTVALVGDSHAAQWFPALERIAKARHWQVLTFVKVACPFLDMSVRNVALKREYRECADWNEAVIARLATVTPDLTLISMSRFAIHPILARDMTIAARTDALTRFVERLPGRVALIVDTPDAGQDVPSCLARHISDVRDCAIPASIAFAGGLGALERAASDATDAGLIDLTSRICRGDPCSVVVDDRIVFRDSRHLTATYSRWLAADLDRAIAAVFPAG
jgi:peptidoglycan/LPS O-acetylase OafA/YrhL